MKTVRQGSRFGLFLMEMVIVLCFFAIMSAVCLRLFAEAALVSNRSTEQNAAMLCLESAAESVKAADGDREKLCAFLGATATADGAAAYYDAEFAPAPEEEAVFSLTVEQSVERGLLSAKLTVYKQGQEFASLAVRDYLGAKGGA